MDPDTEKSPLDLPENIATSNKDASTTKTVEDKTSEDIHEEILESSQETKLEEEDNSKTHKDSITKDSTTNDSTTNELQEKDSITKSNQEDETVSDEKQKTDNDLKTNGSVNDESIKDNEINTISNIPDVLENTVKEETGETQKEIPPSEYPEFAVIQSFLSMFGVELDLPIVSLVDLDNVFSPSYRLSIDKGIKIINLMSL